MELLTEKITEYQKEAKRAAGEIFLIFKKYWDYILYAVEDDLNDDDEYSEPFSYKIEHLETFDDIEDYVGYDIPGTYGKDGSFILGIDFDDDPRNTFLQERGWDIQGTYKDGGDIHIDLILDQEDIYAARKVKWDELYFTILHVVTHEYEHALQMALRDERTKFDVDADYEKRKNNDFLDGLIDIDGEEASGNVYYYTRLLSEIEAELQANWLVANKLRGTKKHKGKSRGQVFVEYITDKLEKLSLQDFEIDYILDKWREYARKNFPHIKF